MWEWRFKRLQHFKTGLQPWNEACDEALSVLEERARRSICFVAVKQ